YTGARTLWDMQFSPDGERVVTAEEDVAVRVWDAQSSKILLNLNDNRANARFSPDGRFILTNGNGNAHVWDADTGRLLSEIDSDEPEVNNVAFVGRFSRDSKRVVIGWGDSSVTVSDATSGKLISLIKGLGKYLENVGFSNDGKHVLTGDGTSVRVWEADTGKFLLTVDGFYEPELSPDEQRIATIGAKVANICDAKSGKVVATLRHDDNVRGLEFSKDGEHVLTKSDNSPARVWTILNPDAGTPPPWFVDFLYYMA